MTSQTVKENKAPRQETVGRGAGYLDDLPSSGAIVWPAPWSGGSAGYQSLVSDTPSASEER